MVNEKVIKTDVYTAVKVMTAILVVAGHVAVMYTSDGVIPVLGASRALAALTKIIYRFHMPLFFFISGSRSFEVDVGKPVGELFRGVVGGFRTVKDKAHLVGDLGGKAVQSLEHRGL